MPILNSLVSRLVALMLLTSAIAIAIVSVIIHQTTQHSFDVQRTNWEALAEQNPSAVQGELLNIYKQLSMVRACQFLEQLDSQMLTQDIVLTDNNQTVHCSTNPRFKYAQVVFHESGVIRLFSDSDAVMAYDLAVSESLPLKNPENVIEGWAMTVEAKPVMLAGSEFAWRVWQQSSAWVFLTLLMVTSLAIAGLKKLMGPIVTITEAAKQLQRGEIPQQINTDVKTTELKALTETFNQATHALTETEQLRQRLVSDIAHELRTPVTNIKGQLEALQLRLISDNDEFHHTVANEVMLLQQLISDFQDLAQTDSGQITLNLNTFPLLELVENCLLSQQRQFTTFSIDIEPHLHIRTDELRFRQVLLNLLENARRAKPEQLHIDVVAQPQEDCVELYFTDNGPGVDDKDAPHIFERFYRAEKSRNRNSGGSGLGLAIVKGLMQRMHGDIQYRKAQNGGACFVLQIQLAESPETTKEK